MVPHSTQCLRACCPSADAYLVSEMRTSWHKATHKRNGEIAPSSDLGGGGGLDASDCVRGAAEVAMSKITAG